MTHRDTASVVSNQQGWRFWVDRGGTFTDVVAQKNGGALESFKLLSSDPEHYDDATIEAIRRCLAVPQGHPLPTEQVREVRVGTTVATNALLERTGAKTALLVTAGFGDLPVIGDQRRPSLFALDIQRPSPLAHAAFEITERLDATGHVVEALDDQSVLSALRQARAAQCTAVAIAFVHSTANPAHEQRAAELAAEYGFCDVATSHRISLLPGFLERMQTTVVEAYLQSSVTAYVEHLRTALPGVPIRFMQSSGALVNAEHFRARHALLSGPAGGVVGAARVGPTIGAKQVIGFDMGGTSTDVFHIADRIERVDETQVAGVTVRSPSVQLHTVAAGGGSKLGALDGRAVVGPESAGAHPGPACYGRRGPAATTDANLILGRLRPDRFPAMFGADARQPLDIDAARQAIRDVTAALHLPVSQSLEQLAYGYLEIAVENMANAIRRITVEQGIDTQDNTLIAFGGAGGQLACLVAQALDLRDVFVPDAAGVLSALGIGLAERSHLEQLAIDQVLAKQPIATWQVQLQAAAEHAQQRLVEQGVPADGIRLTYTADLHFDGTDTVLSVPFEQLDDLPSAFLKQHHQTFGFADTNRQIRLRSLNVEAWGGGSPYHPTACTTDEQPIGDPIELWAKTHGRLTQVVAQHRHRDAMATGDQQAGPALITEPNSCIVVEPGWTATRELGGLRLRRCDHHSQPALTAADTETVDPIQLEIIHNRLMAIATQMGDALRRTAHSVNVRERMDFSCAIYTESGELVANAPHIPVHLGSMGAAVQSLLERHRDALTPGSAWLLNNPYLGGTHLPDLTVVAPRFDPAGELVQLVAARAHHADVGGITPGSVPAESEQLSDEGIVFDGLCLVDETGFREAAVRAHLNEGPYPARQPDLNIVDLRAQVAACHHGIVGLDRLEKQIGTTSTRAYLRHILDHADQCVRHLVRRLAPGSGHVTLDDGTPIHVQLSPTDASTLLLDFSGTGRQHPGNRNAPLAITRAAVLYVLRCLLDRPLPLNDGCLRPVTLRIPSACILNPNPPAAVVAGNVETSQAVVNALLEAFGACAHAQGTMNNLSFGTQRAQYYETIGGGSGAGPCFSGGDAIQTHMTNSRMTDVEILERRHPVRVEQFSIRQHSGGLGQYRGGHGIIRRLRFLEAMDVSVLSSQRDCSPRGLAGGQPGTPGCNEVLRADGSVESFGPQARFSAAAGDRLEIRTPGGGGWGTPR